MFGKTKQKKEKVLTKSKKAVKQPTPEQLQQEKINLENCGNEIGSVLQKYGYGLAIDQNIVLRKVA